jgi:hypothetical protein
VKVSWAAIAARRRISRNSIKEVVENDRDGPELKLHRGKSRGIRLLPETYRECIGLASHRSR